MRLQKHQRLALHAIRHMCPKSEAYLRPASKHPKLVVKYAGHEFQITVSSTPACAEDVVRKSIRDLLHRFARAGLVIPKKGDVEVFKSVKKHRPSTRM